MSDEKPTWFKVSPERALGLAVVAGDIANNAIQSSWMLGFLNEWRRDFFVLAGSCTLSMKVNTTS